MNCNILLVNLIVFQNAFQSKKISMDSVPQSHRYLRAANARIYMLLNFEFSEPKLLMAENVKVNTFYRCIAKWCLGENPPALHHNDHHHQNHGRWHLDSLPEGNIVLSNVQSW